MLPEILGLSDSWTPRLGPGNKLFPSTQPWSVWKITSGTWDLKTIHPPKWDTLQKLSIDSLDVLQFSKFFLWNWTPPLKIFAMLSRFDIFSLFARLAPITMTSAKNGSWSDQWVNSQYERLEKQLGSCCKSCNRRCWVYSEWGFWTMYHWNFTERNLTFLNDGIIIQVATYLGIQNSPSQSSKGLQEKHQHFPPKA